MTVQEAARMLGVSKGMVLQPVKTYLYRHFNSHGILLYVGISLNAITRFSEHRSSSKWSSQIASMTIEQFSSHAEAYDAETQAIRTEHPRHNISKTTKQKIKLKSLSISMKPKRSLLDVFHSLGITPKLRNDHE